MSGVNGNVMMSDHRSRTDVITCSNVPVVTIEFVKSDLSRPAYIASADCFHSLVKRPRSTHFFNLAKTVIRLPRACRFRLAAAFAGSPESSKQILMITVPAADKLRADLTAVKKAVTSCW